MSFHIKICGLKDPDLVDIAINAGADMIGLVFFSKSPRHLKVEEAARVALAAHSRAITVGLFVNPDDLMLKRIIPDIPLTHIQLHGTETPERVNSIRQRFGLPVLKAVGIAAADDLQLAHTYTSEADMLLLDTKPPKGSDLPGGHGIRFDRNILQYADFKLPWLLAGGLTPENVASAITAAIHLPGFSGVDVSSGVEKVRGEKDADLIREFVTNAKAALPASKTKET